MKNRNILFVDTLTSGAGMTIDREGEQFFAAFGERFEYSRDLIKVFDSVLKKARITPKDLSGVMVLTGPGSYTSIRIALSFANALGFAQNIPVQGMTLFEAAENSGKERIVAEAGRGNIFYRLGKKEGVMPEKDLKGKYKKATVDVAYVFSKFEGVPVFMRPASAHYITPPNISKPKKK